MRDVTSQKDSALPENSKITSLTNEMVRRMSNTSELLSDKVRIRVVDEFAQKMINSGYQLVQARRVVMGGLKGYERKLRDLRNCTEQGLRVVEQDKGRRLPIKLSGFGKRKDQKRKSQLQAREQ